ncbi:GGDEF domain-containing protein [Bacillus piscicola]|uniref:GGDEF domain-containing protein n=1 Tax=Bacillus piscicola TaxID=1632684 RepID=UPI001F08A883|nr:GGDEF domain-containing protein [Bacillus piscicola]
MKENFKRKLFLIMIGFALVFSLTIATVDHLRLKEQVMHHHQLQIEQTEDMVVYALQSLEKAYSLFDQETTVRMKENTTILMDLYEKKPLDDWDFRELRERLGMDIYLINEENTITHSSYREDIGMNFSECCQKLARVLDKRRASGAFFDDGLDIEQTTGAIKKYSYMATPDKKYIIELGYALEDGAIFEEFNFLRVIDELVDKYPSIDGIHVLNIGGYSLGTPVDDAKLTKERRDAFEHTLATHEISEIESSWQGEPATYRYVPHVSALDTGTTRNKVVEVVYNDHELQALLLANKNKFVWELIIILLSAVAISLLISKWVAKPMYLAFHDSLTGLKNRAAFDEGVTDALSAGEHFALLMIDLDNFKAVNDHLGHDKGDELLQQMAVLLRESIRKTDTPFRLGGDEFVITLPGASQQEAEAIAMRLIDRTKEMIETRSPAKDIAVTVSIGIALAPEHARTADALYKKADIALYTSKEKGKNQHYVYTETIRHQLL